MISGGKRNSRAVLCFRYKLLHIFFHLLLLLTCAPKRETWAGSSENESEHSLRGTQQGSFPHL